MIETIITSSLLILVIILLRFAFRGKISRRLQYALWGLVLLRLLCPFALFDSPMSVMNAVDVTAAEQRISGQPAPPPSAAVAPAEHTAVTGAATAADASAPGAAAPPPMTAAPGDVLKAVWLTGAGVVGLWCILTNILFYRRLRRYRRPCDAESYILALAGTDDRAAPQRRLPVYSMENIASPCLFGLFRPAIYLTPKATATEASVRHVLTHEQCHYAHGDHLWSLLRGVCLSLYWFNPLVWVAAVMSRTDCELACDEAAVKRLGTDQRLNYGRSLIDLIAVKAAPAGLMCAATTMNSGPKSIKERLNMIIKHPKTLLPALITVLLVMTVAAGCTFTGAKTGADVQSAMEAVRQPFKAGNLEAAQEKIAAAIIAEQIEYFQNERDIPVIDQRVNAWREWASYDDVTAGGRVYLYELDYAILPQDPGVMMLGASGLMDEEGWISRLDYGTIPLIWERDGRYMLVQIFNLQSFEGFYDLMRQLQSTAAPAGNGADDSLGFSANRRMAVIRAISDHAELELPATVAEEGLNFVLLQAIQGGMRETGVFADAGGAVACHSHNYRWDGFTLHMDIEVTFADGSAVDGQAHYTENGATVDVSDFMHQLGAPLLRYYLSVAPGWLDYHQEPYRWEDTPGYAAAAPDRTDLDSCVAYAILTNNDIHGKRLGDFSATAHTVLATEENGDLTTVYAVATYYRYEYAEGRTFSIVGGSIGPVAITFSRDAAGKYTMTEYWKAQDGGNYGPSIKAKFPAEIYEDAMDGQKYALAHSQSCYAQAVEYGNIDTAPIIEELIATIMAGAPDPWDPYDYHYLALRELTYYGDYTLRYIFTEFLRGGQTGPKGNIMRSVMDDLIGGESMGLETANGQEYFNEWRALVEGHSMEYTREHAPKAFLLLQLLADESYAAAAPTEAASADDVLDLPNVRVVREGERYRLIDKMTELPVSSAVYDEVACERYPDERYSDKYIKVRSGEHWGLLDGRGGVILAPGEYELNSINVQTYEEVWPIIDVTRNGLYGAIDYNGGMVIEPEWQFLFMDVYNVPNTVFVFDGRRWGAIKLDRDLNASAVDYSVATPEWIIDHYESTHQTEAAPVTEL